MKNKQKRIGNIKWRSKDVQIVEILPTPKNYKIKNDLGLSRLQTSLSDYGIAGSVIVNPLSAAEQTKLKTKCKWVLIDGNSRLEELKAAGEKIVSISYPNRPLSSKEFVDMCKLFDLAKAGDVDIKSIEAEGTTADYFKRFGLEVPMHLLNNMGARVNVKELEFPDKKGKATKEAPVNDVQMVQLFFTVKQEKEYRAMEQKLMKRFKTVTTHDTVLKAFKVLTK